MSGSKSKTLIVICGPTAVGKTSVSIEIAKAMRCPIISFDSRQFYKEMRIGNARPTDSELAEAEHHFIANRSTEDRYTAGMFEEEALEKLDEIFESADFCIAVGGSGLYIDALCKGMDKIPHDETYREILKSRLETEGLEVLQSELQKIDPDYFEIADVQNPRRVMRALEAHHITGKTYSELRTQTGKERGFNILWIGLEMEREKLFDRINLRVDQMMEEGLLEEVRELIGLRDRKGLQTVGYRELFSHLDGEYDLDEAIRLIKRNSRRYAKQQIGWFKKNPEIHWFKPSELEQIKSLVQEKFMA